jgi:hypothetical protein
MTAPSAFGALEGAAQLFVFCAALTQGFFQRRAIEVFGFGHPPLKILDFLPDPIEVPGNETDRHGSLRRGPRPLYFLWRRALP